MRVTQSYTKSDSTPSLQGSISKDYIYNRIIDGQIQVTKYSQRTYRLRGENSNGARVSGRGTDGF